MSSRSRMESGPILKGHHWKSRLYCTHQQGWNRIKLGSTTVKGREKAIFLAIMILSKLLLLFHFFMSFSIFLLCIFRFYLELEKWRNDVDMLKEPTITCYWLDKGEVVSIWNNFFNSSLNFCFCFCFNDEDDKFTLRDAVCFSWYKQKTCWSMHMQKLHGLYLSYLISELTA